MQIKVGIKQPISVRLCTVGADRVGVALQILKGGFYLTCRSEN